MNVAKNNEEIGIVMKPGVTFFTTRCYCTNDFKDVLPFDSQCKDVSDIPFLSESCINQDVLLENEVN